MPKKIRTSTNDEKERNAKTVYHVERTEQTEQGDNNAPGSAYRVHAERKKKRKKEAYNHTKSETKMRKVKGNNPTPIHRTWTQKRPSRAVHIPTRSTESPRSHTTTAMDEFYDRVAAGIERYIFYTQTENSSVHKCKPYRKSQGADLS